MDTRQILLDALERDLQLALKPSSDNKFLQGGHCPECHKRSVWVPVENPWTLQCNHQNKCGFSESVRDRYRDLLENLSDRYQPTEQNPHATADAYLRERRGFSTAPLAGCYQQGQMLLPGGGYAETVRFYMPNSTDFWERVINERDVRLLRKNGKDKARIVFAYSGTHWQLPAQTYEDGDVVYITEGIFHAIAFCQAGYKAVASFSTSNLPRQLIQTHKDKKITWRLAFDGDEAGIKAHKKYAAELKKLGVKWEVVLPPARRDWDELFRDEKLNDETLKECLYRGRLLMAESVVEKFFVHYCRRQASSTVLEFDHAWYRCEVDNAQLVRNLSDLGITLEHEHGFDAFRAEAKCIPFSNCVAEFLYGQTDKITGEISYFFRVRFSNGARERTLSLDGGSLAKNDAFGKALIKNATGATFDGNTKDYRIIRDRWFKRAPIDVETVPFLGYDKELQTYVFQSFAYHQGRELAKNNMDFFSVGKQRFKSSFHGIHIEKTEHFDNSWFDPFLTAFGRNGVFGLAFWLGSLFAEQIRAKHKSFPFLELTGEPGAGKSLLIEFLWVLCGRGDHEGFDPSRETLVGRSRKLNQLSNMPAVLIESDRKGDGNSARKGAFDFSELKPMYNGRSTRGMGAKTVGNETVDLPFRGTIVIAQNAQVDAEEAVLQRIVHCHFSTAHFTPEGRKYSETLFKPATTTQYAGFLTAALKKEPELLAKFFASYAEYEQRFIARGFAENKLTNYRLIHNHAQIAALCACLPMLFPQMSAQRVHQMEDFVYSRAVVRQESLAADHPFVRQFWEIYELLNSEQDDLEPYKEEVLNHSPNNQEIAISLPHFEQIATRNQVRLPASLIELQKLLPNCQSHKFIGQRVVRSKIVNKTVRCWVFASSVGAA